MYRIMILLVLSLCTACAGIIGAGPDPEEHSTEFRAPDMKYDDEAARKKLLSLRKQDQVEQAQRLEQQEQVKPSSPMGDRSTDIAPVTADDGATVATQVETIPDQLWIRVPFKSGFTSVDRKMAKALTDIAGKYLAEPRQQTLVVRGFCDAEPIGGYKGKKHKSIHGYNTQLTLSQSRARAVADILIKAGIREDAVQVEGYGAKHFIADNDTVEGRDRNRRVDVFLISQ